MFRLHNSATVRSLLFGLGVVSVVVLGALWVAVQREHLPGVSASRDVFRLELRSGVNGDPLSRKDVAMLVETALPGAALITLRRVEARLSSGGKDLGKAWVGVLSDDAIEVLGLGLNSGRWWTDRGKASREWVVSPALNTRFRLLNLAPEAQVRIEARGAVDEAGTQLFTQVGEVSSAVTGLGYGIPVDAWVKESEWPNWLFPSDVPERILDMVYPLSMVMLSPREKLDAGEIADRLQRAASANGEVITIDVSKGSARDPSRTPKAQAQTLVYTLIAVATLFVCIFGYLFLWALRLVRGFKDQVIRYMLGEPRGAASRRTLAEIGVEVLVSTVFASFLAIGVIHFLAIRPPFESFALSEFLLSDSEVIEVISLALLLGLLVVLVGHVLSERMLSMVAVRKSNGGASSIHISVLVGGSALAMMVSIGMGLLTFFAQRALEHRDYGFDAQHLVQVMVNRDREQLVDAVFDPQTSASVLSDLRDGLSAISGVVSVSASSKHPLQGYSGGLEYKLPGDREDARRFGNIVHLDSSFFRTLGVSSEMAEMSDGLHPQLFRGIGVDRSFDAVREISGGGRITLFTPKHSDGETLDVIHGFPSVFYTGATGEAVPTMYQAMQRSGQIEWIWIRHSGRTPLADIEVVVDRVLRGAGMRYLSVHAREFGDYLDEALAEQRIEHNTALAASGMLLLLSVGSSLALFLFAGQSRLNEFAIRMAVGASPHQALQGVLRRSALLPLVGLGLGALVLMVMMKPSLALMRLEMSTLVLSTAIAAGACVVLFLLGLVWVAKQIAGVPLRQTLAGER